jgi:hypothetical protein
VSGIDGDADMLCEVKADLLQNVRAGREIDNGTRL